MGLFRINENVTVHSSIFNIRKVSYYMKKRTEPIDIMIQKSENICPHFKKVKNHGRCHAYPDGLMNPSLDEMIHFCLTEDHNVCLYYRLFEKEKESDLKDTPLKTERTAIHGEICERTEDMPLLL